MIQETYRDITVTLLEDENKWQFEVNGRERTAPTLPKAREFIDNALDRVATKKEKPWEPFDAYYNKRWAGSSEYELIKVTSVAESPSYRGPSVWVNRNGKREKQELSDLYDTSPENQEAIVKIGKLNREIEGLESQINQLKQTLKKIMLPA